MQNKKLAFTTKDVSGNEIELAIERPSPKMQVEAQKVYNRAFRNALDSGAILRAKAAKVLVEQGLWDESKDNELVELQKKIIATSKYLEDKTYGNDIEAGKEAADTLKKLRGEFQRLSLERSSLDENTAEYQAEIERLNFLIAICTVYNKDRKAFFNAQNPLEDFYARADEIATIEASTKFLIFINDIDPDFEKNLPENKFFAEQNKPETSPTQSENPEVVS